ncbi:MAG: zinc-binding dehydrogenase [Burkholderiales bacterium]|nr:zinc-binding dehydrogenase [Burkholderiales bacterium]
MKPLETPVLVGRLMLPNRLVMAPMTRSRADDSTGVPSDLVATYYAQRAGAGLIVTEGVFPSPMGKGYVRTPGLHTDEQQAAWRRVTDAVHAAGGRIFMQLMHTGRISHPSLLPSGAQPVAPSAVKAAGQVYLASGPADFVEPRALNTDEIAAVVDDYRQATRRAMEAGFDGVELHAASGYLPEQFLSSGTNLRTDGYGGSIARRARFVLEVLGAMAEAAGADRVGLKINPEMGFNDAHDDTPVQTYTHLVQQIAHLGLAYLHVATGASGFDYHAHLRPLYPGTYLLGGGLDQASAEDHIRRRRADAVVFGSAYLANPDLEQRFAIGAPLNTPARETFYSAGPEGYVDYPALGRALRLHAYGGAESLRVDRLPRPTPGAGEVLVRVHATGLNPLDWKLRSGGLKDAFPLALPTTLGIELAGEVIGAGAGADLAPGTRVLAMLRGLGAYADEVVVPADALTVMPAGLSFTTAAALPVSLLAAQQALFEDGALQAGETVLIHGASGGVGGFAMQLARQAGARVWASASADHAERLRGLGAERIADARQGGLATLPHGGVDLVLDLAGSDPAGLWALLSPAGRLVSTATPQIASLAPAGQAARWVQTRPDAAQLQALAAQVASGALRADIGETVALADVPAVMERRRVEGGRGKAVAVLR